MINQQDLMFGYTRKQWAIVGGYFPDKEIESIEDAVDLLMEFISWGLNPANMGDIQFEGVDYNMDWSFASKVFFLGKLNIYNYPMYQNIKPSLVKMPWAD